MMKRKIELLILIFLIGLSFFILNDYQKYQNNKSLPVIQENVSNSVDKNYLDDNSTKEDYVFLKTAFKKDIKFDENRPNIYLFYGETCPYCEKELSFLEEIYPEYKDYFNLYAFEVWNHEENRELLEQVSQLLNKKIDGVPYLIVGEEVIVGFQESTKDEIINAVMNNYNLKEDVIKKI